MKKQYFVRKNVALIEAQQRQEKKRARRTALYIAIFVAVLFHLLLLLNSKLQAF